MGSKPHKRLSAYIGQGKATNTGLHATRHKHEGAHGGYEGSTVSISLCRCGNGLQTGLEEGWITKVRWDGVVALGRFYDQSHLFSNACISNARPLRRMKSSPLIRVSFFFFFLFFRGSTSYIYTKFHRNFWIG